MARLDLVALDGLGYNFSTASYYTSVSVYLGNGDGTFQTPQSFQVGGEATAIATGDFTCDGRMDVAVAGENTSGQGMISVLQGNGDGSFQAPETYAAGSHEPFAITAGDFTADGILDLAVANGLDDTVSVYLGNGDGTFQRSRPTPWATWRVQSRQGISKATAMTTWRSSMTPRILSPAITRSRYCWATATAPSRPSRPTPWPPNRLDHDGGLHRQRPARLAVVTDLGNDVGAPGQRRRHLPSPQTYACGRRTWVRIVDVAGDFTGDGHLDLAVAKATADTCRCCWATATAPSSPRCLRGGRTFPFDPGGRLHRRRPPRPRRSRCKQLRQPNGRSAAGQRRRHLPAPGRPHSGLLSRLRGGGGLQRRRPPRPRHRQPGGLRFNDTLLPQLDLGAAGQRRRHLPAPQTYAVGQSCVSIVAGTSTATAGSTSPSPTVSSGTREHATGQRRRHLPGPDRLTRSVTIPMPIAVGDFTGDGKLDLAVANEALQHGVGAAGQRRRHLPAPGDLRCRFRSRRHRGGRLHRRRQARPRRRHRNFDNTVSVLLGNGDGTFQPRRLTRLGPIPTPSWSGDFTGDGKLDLAVANARRPTRCRCCWATATAPSRPQQTVHCRERARLPWRRGTSPATATSTSPSPTHTR